MTNEFKEIVESYIEKCNKELDSRVVSTAHDLQEEIVSAFDEVIPNIRKNLDSRSYAVIGGGYKEVDYIGNIKKLKGKLEILLATNGTYKIGSDANADNSKNLHSVVVNANNSVSGSGNSTNTNTNTQTQNQTVNNTLDIKVELDKVRAEVEADEVLDDDAKEEINEKLNEIEEVMNGSSTNNEKWKKLKDTFKWVATKSYKVGKWIMPIITKVLFQNAE